MVTINKVLRILSYVCISSPVPFVLVGKAGSGSFEVCESFWIGACAVLLSSPLSAEVLSERWRGAVVPIVSYLTLILFYALGCNPLIPVFVILSCLVLLLYLRHQVVNRERFIQERLLQFHHSQHPAVYSTHFLCCGTLRRKLPEFAVHTPVLQLFGEYYGMAAQ